MTEQDVDDAALRLARRLDVALFFIELHEEHPNKNTLRLDARRLRELHGIDVFRFIPE